MSASPVYEQINFLPSWYVAQLNRRRWVHRKIVITALLVMACGTVWIMTHNQKIQLEGYLANLQGQVMAAEGKLTEVAKLQKAKQSLERSLRIYNQLARPIAFHDVSSTIGALTPQTIYLNDFEVKVKKLSRKVAVPGQTDASGKPKIRTEHYEIMQVQLHGAAPSNLQIANYVGRLAGSNLFRNVKMVKSREADQDGALVRQFQIEMQVPLDRSYRLEASQQEVAHAD